jgi:membrane protease YdiL (CAAX protease family)
VSDSGTPRTATFAWIVAILAFICVVAIQQGLFAPHEPKKITTASLVAPSDDDPVLQTSKMMVKLRVVIGDPDRKEGKQLTSFLEQESKDPVALFRSAIVEAELAGPESASTHLKDLDFAAIDDQGARFVAEVDEASLAGNRDTVLQILSQGTDSLSEEQRKSLTDHHGYYGDLILSYDKPNTDPARARLVEGGGAILLVIGIIILVVAVYAILGIVMMILFFVRLGRGKVVRAFVPPAPGGSVYIEAVALFFSSFVALQASTHFLPDSIRPGINAKLMLQWVFLVIPFWPLVRGVSGTDFRRQLGLIAPKGLAHEIGAGAFAYFAALPLLAVAFVITILLVILLKSLGHQSNLHNPIQDLVSQSNTLTLVLFFTLATIWAPLTEEMIFRGALFRQLRGRWAVLIAAPASALFFAFMHPYPLPLLIPIFTLGLIFSLMREWRGSLAASMTAHFIHNFTLLTISIAFVEAMK